VEFENDLRARPDGDGRVAAAPRDDPAAPVK